MATHSRVHSLSASAFARSVWFASGLFTSVSTRLPLVSMGTAFSDVRKRPAASRSSKTKPTPSSKVWHPAQDGMPAWSS